MFEKADEWGQRYSQPPHKFAELTASQRMFDMRAMEIGQEKDHEFKLRNRDNLHVAVIVRR